MVDSRRKRKAGESYLECALRETREEFCGRGLVPPELEAMNRNPDTPPVGIQAPGWPFFRWKTFLIELEARPPLADWPVGYKCEFLEVAWFPADGLPEDIHPFLRWTLSCLRDRLSESK